MHEASAKRGGLSYAAAAGMLLLMAVVLAAGLLQSGPHAPAEEQSVIKLPEPDLDGRLSIEQALLKRRSVRKYRDEPLTFAEISQLLWAAQGITDPRGFRTAPSAGALYPLELYLVAGKVINLDSGVYKYRSDGHELIRVAEGDRRAELSAAARQQRCVQDGAAVIVFAAVYERTARKYGRRAEQYVHIEAGHAVQNVYLQAVPLKLGTVFVGAFDDDAVKRTVGLEPDERPLGMMPVGRIE